jgi:Amt family ammonium transporter
MILMTVLLLFMILPSWGEETATPTADQITELLQSPKVIADTMWTLITAMLVFFMNLGFAMVESGLCRAKNCVNILAKNFVVFASRRSLFSFWGGA